MPDNPRTYSPRIPTSTSWSIESLKPENKVVRKFINSAIYVEKHIMPPLRKKSPVYAGSDGEYTSRSCTTADNFAKKCSCETSRLNCPCHGICNVGYPRKLKSTKTKQMACKRASYRIDDEVSDEESYSGSSDSGSRITIRATNKKRSVGKSGDASPRSTGGRNTAAGGGSQFKLPLSPLGTSRTTSIDAKDKQEIIRNWLKKKDEEKKKKEAEEAKIRAQKELERQKVLEKEKENFRKWLEDKKAKEEKAKKEKERKELEKQREEAEKEKKLKDNQASFNMWLKRKKRADIEKKIKEKLTVLQSYEEKQRRLEENEKAFNEWLKSSKTKPKPLPLNKGLDSLCSSTSVTYINPTPWMPNVEPPAAK